MIDDLPHYRREIFEGSRLDERISGVHGPNFTKLGEDIQPSSVDTEFVSELRYLGALSNGGASKLIDIDNNAKFHTF